MERIQGWPAAPLGPSAVAFGNFDGLHVGHRAIIASLRAAAVGFGGGVTLATFDPHPLSLLRPERAPRAIDPLELRLGRFAAAGVDRVVVLRFDETLRQTSAKDFAERLFRQLDARVLIASTDSRFGAGGRGDIGLLRDVAAAHRARVLQIPAISRQGERVSSSRVRRLIEAGDVEQAWALLERPFELEGEVVHGDARGRTIGFPTANLATVGQVVPAAGVYVAQLLVDGTWLPAVANLGLRPTVDGGSWRTEAHVLDRTIDLYGKRVRLQLLRHLRGERRFADLDALRVAIADDAAAARGTLAAWSERGVLA